MVLGLAVQASTRRQIAHHVGKLGANALSNVYLVTFDPSFTNLRIRALLPPADGTSDESAVVSPDGRQFAFVAGSNGSFILYKASVSGGEPTEVSNITSILAGYSQNIEGVVVLAWQ